jgi:hypothetical protein
MSNEELIAFLKKNLVAVGCVVASLAIGVTVYLRSDLLPEAEKVFAQNSQKRTPSSSRTSMRRSPHPTRRSRTA